MSQKELTRANIIQCACDGLITVYQASQRLNHSTRRIKQLKKEYRKHGAVSLVHGNANQPSPKAIPPEIEQQIINLKQLDRFERCNFKHFHEILRREYSINISYSSVYRTL